MTTNFRLLAIAAVTMLAMNSCVKEENLGNGDKKGTPVEFEMGINTISRTTTEDNSNITNFAEGDAVGIFVYSGTTPVATNVQYKLVSGNWVAEGEPIYVETGAVYSYYAYYPYDSEATNAMSLKLSADTDQRSGYTGSDALIAKSETVEAGATTVALNFSHIFTLVQVELQGNLVKKDATVYLQNIQPTATINLKESSASAIGDKGNVAMKFCDTNTDAAPFSYRAIVPAQTISTGDGFLVVSLDGKNYKFKYSSDIPYESGKMRQFNVKLESAEQSVSVGTIENWGTSTEITGTSNLSQTSYIESLFDCDALADVIGSPSMTEDAWFGLKRAENEPGDITYTIEDDATTDCGKAAKFSYTSTWDAEANKGEGKAVNNSWYLATLGYYHCSADAPINGGIYKVTLKVKGGKTTAGSTSKLVFTCRNADNSSSFGAATNQNFLATTVSVTPDAANTWQEYIFYINFDKKSTAVGTVPTDKIEEGQTNYAKRWIDSSASDYSKFDLRIYTNDAATSSVTSNTATIYISDVKMEPYVAE